MSCRTSLVNISINISTRPQRITGLYALRRLTAARVPQNTSRASALCGVLLHYSFAVAGMLRIPLSQSQNRRIQPERYV